MRSNKRGTLAAREGTLGHRHADAGISDCVHDYPLSGGRQLLD